MPRNADRLVICNRSSNVYIMSLDGTVVQTLSSGKREGGNFMRCAVSAAGRWLYAVAEDSYLYCFEVAEGKLQHLLKVHEKDAIGVATHPQSNLVATWSADSTLRLWRSSVDCHAAQ